MGQNVKKKTPVSSYLLGAAPGFLVNPIQHPRALPFALFTMVEKKRKMKRGERERELGSGSPSPLSYLGSLGPTHYRAPYENIPFFEHATRIYNVLL
jgi:hypothetical protein